jgi:hypothetical protein
VKFRSTLPAILLALACYQPVQTDADLLAPRALVTLESQAREDVVVYVATNGATIKRLGILPAYEIRTFGEALVTFQHPNAYIEVRTVAHGPIWRSSLDDHFDNVSQSIKIMVLGYNHTITLFWR